MKYILPALTLVFFSAVIYTAKLSVSFNFAVLQACFLLILWIFYFKYKKIIKAESLLALLLTLSTFVTFETILKNDQQGYFPKESKKAPLFIPPDKGNEVFRKNGFRGKRPCQECPDNLIRIVTTGGSSTYGIPLYYSEDTYSAELQRLLDQRRIGENYEVLNGGIAGYGIMQIVDSLEQEILKYKPHIVTVCAWFNDSSPLPSWYGFADKSDKESYQTIKVLGFIEKIPGFKWIYNTSSFAFFRYYLIESIKYAGSLSAAEKDMSASKTKRKKIRPRMDTQEFEWGLEEVVRLSKKHNFLPIFVYEALNRTPAINKVSGGKKYYKIIDKVAAKHDITVIDTLEEFARHRSEWMFYDFIHPNKAGHTLIAESIYHGIFTKPITASAQNFLSAKGIDLKMSDAKKEYFYQIEKKELAGKKIHLKVSTPFSDRNKTLVLNINSRDISEYTGINNQPKDLTIDIPQEYSDRPITDIKFRIKASSAEINNPVGTTGVYSHSHIAAKSGGKNNGWQQKIEIDGVSYAGNYDGYGIVVVGAETGTVKDIMRFNFTGKSANTDLFYQYIKNVSRYTEGNLPPIVIITLKTDGFLNTNQKLLSETFKLLGGSGRTPHEFESFILIGTPGALPGQAVEMAGGRLLETEIGSKKDINHKLINITDFNIH